MSDLARQLIAENKRTKNPFLDLGNCGLHNYLPEELLECIWLERLNLGNFYFDKGRKIWIKTLNIGRRNSFNGDELMVLKSLTALQSLDLRVNNISDIGFLKNLTALQSLDLSFNEISAIGFLEKLTELQSLDLSFNKISDYSVLEKLTALQYLNLYFNKISDIGFLKELTALQSLDLSSNQISDYSVLEKLTALQSLNLYNNKISDIGFLKKLTALQSLNLSSNQISDYNVLGKLKALQSLDLYNNKISDIGFLEKLTELQSLNLSSNKISDYSVLEKLTALQSLYLNANQISDIGFLKELTALQSLDLSSNQISDYSALEKLTALQSLVLSSNQISDIGFLKKLTALQSLNLSSNQISDIGFLKKLTALQSLNLSSNQISDYSALEKLTALQSLDLSSNNISDIGFLKKLTALQSLDLSSNHISDIGFLENLTRLQSLNLSSNEISDIKSILLLLSNGLEIDLEAEYSWELESKIGLKGNPIINPPLEIVKQGREAVIEHFEGKRKSLNECKLIFVGDGGVGKTSLMRRVVYDTFNKNEVTTHGINKIAWEKIKNQKGETIRVNLWDFGGQHIQHSLHQFFFTERVIYVLVLNPRNDQKAYYWLDQIEKLGRDSEILIAYNCKQEEDKKADFLSNFYELRKKYPKVPEPFLLSCQTGEGIEPFKKALTAHILRNEGLNAEYLVKWFNIKQRLEEEVSIGKNYITYETYQTWCNEEEYDDLDRQKNLLKILDSVGSIVFFDKPILDALQVLNPEWLTTGAYSILVSEQNRVNKGHLSWHDLKEIFKDEKEIFSDRTIRIKYTENQFQFIIELMLQYGLCQRDPFHQNSFLIPSAFGEKPNRDYSFAKQEAQSYRLQFDSPFEMLIIHRFIAKNLLKIEGKDYWQSGIYIKHPDSETYALIETNLYSKQIDCWIKGNNIRGFWEVIRADFREILSIYHNFNFKEQVLYKKDGNETFLPYDEMLNSLRNGVRIIPYHPSYQLSNIDVLEVLDLFEDKNQTQRKMENERINIKIENNPHFEQKNVNKATVNIKVDVTGLKEFSEIKELLLDLEEYNVENEAWKKALVKALDEFNKLEDAEEKSQQKTSISIIDRTFKKLKDLKDVVAIGFLSVDIEKKLPTLLEQWETFKGFFV